MQRESFGLSDEELGAYGVDGFIVREAVFDAAELAELRAAAEAAVELAASSAPTTSDYWHDGNRYREAAGSTIQFEHAPGSETVRVIEPFHHLDARLDRLIDDPRLVEPARALEVPIRSRSSPTSSISSGRAKARAFAGTRIHRTGRISSTKSIDCRT